MAWLAGGLTAAPCPTAFRPFGLRSWASDVQSKVSSSVGVWACVGGDKEGSGAAVLPRLWTADFLSSRNLGLRVVAGKIAP